MNPNPGVVQLQRAAQAFSSRHADCSEKMAHFAFRILMLSQSCIGIIIVTCSRTASYYVP